MRADALRPREPFVRTAFRAERERDAADRDAAASRPCRDIASSETVPHGQFRRAFSDARTRAERGWVLIRVRAARRAVRTSGRRAVVRSGRCAFRTLHRRAVVLLRGRN